MKFLLQNLIWLLAKLFPTITMKKLVLSTLLVLLFYKGAATAEFLAIHVHRSQYQ